MFPQIVISCGPNPREIATAEELCIGQEEKVLSTGGRFTWSQLADLLGSAAAFIGVDTAAMHLAAAVQCPSVALFGNPPAYQYGPWHTPHRIVRARDSMNETERYKLPGEQLMKEIEVASVMEALESLLAETKSSLCDPGVQSRQFP
jgi:heptosyltransferase-3